MTSQYNEISRLFSNNKTTYSIVNEDSIKSSITMDSDIADILQIHLDNVHEWIQAQYDLICQKSPKLSRRKKGDILRQLALKKVENTPERKEWTNNLVKALL